MATRTYAVFAGVEAGPFLSLSAEKLVAEMLGVKGKKDVSPVRIHFEFAPYEKAFDQVVDVGKLFGTC